MAKATPEQIKEALHGYRRLADLYNEARRDLDNGRLRETAERVAAAVHGERRSDTDADGSRVLGFLLGLLKAEEILTGDN
jgi:hypothetical protein